MYRPVKICEFPIKKRCILSHSQATVKELKPQACLGLLKLLEFAKDNEKFIIWVPRHWADKLAKSSLTGQALVCEVPK